MSTTETVSEKVGATLAFYREATDDKHEAVLSSFVVEYSTEEDLETKCLAISVEQIEKEHQGFEYLGINDLFVVNIKGDLKFLGRTMLDDLKEGNQAESLCIPVDEVESKLQAKTKESVFNLELVYFHVDEEGEEFDCTIIVFTCVNTSNWNYQKVVEFGESQDWLQLICDSSVEQLSTKGLKFVGLEGIYEKQGKGFLELYTDQASKEQLLKDVLSADEIAEHLSDVEIDMSDIKGSSKN